MPDVSIIMPVYNRHTLLHQAVRSALAEAKHLDLELICVDDGSTDGSFEELQRYDAPVRALRLDENSGQSAARNAGLDEAAGEFVLFLDSDDELEPGHLPRAVALARDSRADIVVSAWGDRGPDRECVYEAPVFAPTIADALLAGRAVPTSAALYRRHSGLRWDPTLRKLDDWDFFVRAALDAKRIVTLPEIAYWVVDHGGSRITRESTMLANAREVYAILAKLESRLAHDGVLTDERRKRLAQYLYKELRVLSLYDRNAFENVLEHIYELDPRFVPRDEERQPFMRVAARVLGTRNAVLLHSAVKRMLKGES